MNLPYRISAAAANPKMALGMHLRVERSNGIDIAAPALRVR